MGLITLRFFFTSLNLSLSREFDDLEVKVKRGFMYRFNFRENGYMVKTTLKSERPKELSESFSARASASNEENLHRERFKVHSEP